MSVSSQKKEKWFQDLIENFRTNSKDISQEERNLLNELDFWKPCQIHLYCFIDNKQREFNLIIVDHNESEEDKKITINGLFNIDNSKQNEKLDNLLKSDSNYPKLREIVIQDVRNHYQRDVSSEFRIRGSKQLIHERRCYLWKIEGSLNKGDVVIISDLMIASRKAQTKNQGQIFESLKAFEQKRGKQNLAIGGFMKPPMWIGELPEVPPSKQLKGEFMDRYIQYLVNGEDLRGNKFFLTNDGFIAYQYQTKEPTKLIPEVQIPAIKFLNELFGIFLLHNIPIFSVESTEFSGWNVFFENDLHLNTSVRAEGYQNDRMNERNNFIDEKKLKNRRQVKLDEISKIIDLSNKIPKLKVKKSLLRFMTYSFTSLAQGEFEGSLILSWTIVEQWIDAKWKKLIAERKITGDRKDTLNDNRVFTASTKLEVFELTKTISSKDYLKLRELRKIRNGIIHNVDSQVNRRHAQECIDIARFLLLDLINQELDLLRRAET